MLTAWLIASALVGIVGMFGELRKGKSLPIALTGFACSFILWPVLVLFAIMVYVIMFFYVLGMKFF